MDQRNKNILIGGLLAIVLVMAVGYAAFATQLNITGTANITSNWDIRFDETAGSVSVEPGTLADGTTKGTMVEANQTISYPEENNGLKAELAADLIQPGDTVTFTLTVKNYGSIDATPGTPEITLEGGTKVSDYVWTIGHVKYTITPPTLDLSGETNGTDTITVVAKFIDIDENGEETTSNTSSLTKAEGAGETDPTEQSVLGITLVYTQK